MVRYDQYEHDNVHIPLKYKKKESKIIPVTDPGGL
jgi:hypothetical protein